MQIYSNETCTSQDTCGQVSESVAHLDFSQCFYITVHKSKMSRMLNLNLWSKWNEPHKST